MLLDKLESGIVALETEYGPVYVQPSGWQRLYLLWTFRHFNSLPLKTLNSRQRKLVERLPRCGARGLWSGLDRMQVIGTVEGAKAPSSSLSPESITHTEPAETVFVHSEVFSPFPSLDLHEENEIPDEGMPIQPSTLARRRGHLKTALAFATAAIFAVVAVNAWHRFQPMEASKTASVSARTPVAENGYTEVAAQSDTTTAPMQTPSPSVDQTPLDQTGQPANIFAPSQSEAKLSASRLSIEKPAAIISPLEPEAIHSTVKQTPAEDNATEVRKKGNPIVASIQKDKVQEETPRIQFSGPPRRLIYPDYPDTKVRGKVSLKAVIGGDGRVREVKILSGNKILSAAAARAVRQWRYDPFYKDGEPVETETNVSVLFVSADVISLSFPSALPLSR